MNSDFGEKFATKALASFLKPDELNKLASEHGFEPMHQHKFHYTINGSDDKPNRLAWKYEGTDGRRKDRSIRRSSDGFRGLGRFVVDFEGEAVPISNKNAIDPFYHEKLTVISHDKESTHAPTMFNDKERASFISTYSTAVDELATTGDSTTIFTLIQRDHKYENWDAVAVQFNTVEGKKVRQCTPLKKKHHENNDDEPLQNKLVKILANTLINALK